MTSSYVLLPEQKYRSTRNPEIRAEGDIATPLIRRRHKGFIQDEGTEGRNVRRRWKRRVVEKRKGKELAPLQPTIIATPLGADTVLALA